MNDQTDEHTFKTQAECGSCNGTGLYVGVGERDGAAVVCSTCKGTGERTLKLTYKEFKGRTIRKDVKRVFRVNPGICIGEDEEKNLRLSDFGGVTFEAWILKGNFPSGSEDRNHTCPAWFYQSANYDLKPDWIECSSSLGGTFSSCKCFSMKHKCWAQWDMEFGEKGEKP